MHLSRQWSITMPFIYYTPLALFIKHYCDISAELALSLRSAQAYAITAAHKGQTCQHKDNKQHTHAHMQKSTHRHTHMRAHAARTQHAQH